MARNGTSVVGKPTLYGAQSPPGTKGSPATTRYSRRTLTPMRSGPVAPTWHVAGSGDAASASGSPLLPIAPQHWKIWK